MTSSIPRAKLRLSYEELSALSIAMLRQGKDVRVPAGGFSMFPYLKKGDMLRISPISPERLCIGDIIVFERKERLIAHRLYKIEFKNDNSADNAAFQASQSENNDELPNTVNTDSPTDFALIPNWPEFSATTIGDACRDYDEQVHSGNYLGKVIAFERKGQMYDQDKFSDRLYRWLIKIMTPFLNQLFYYFKRFVNRMGKRIKNIMSLFK